QVAGNVVKMIVAVEGQYRISEMTEVKLALVGRAYHAARSAGDEPGRFAEGIVRETVRHLHHAEHPLRRAQPSAGAVNKNKLGLTGCVRKFTFPFLQYADHVFIFNIAAGT